jgi:FkbM family methyltransferase
MSEPFTLRPGKYDEVAFLEAYQRNEYRLPEAFKPDDIIVDIGTHVGSFCYAALRRGSHRVYGFEANPANFECALQNLQAFGDRVRLRNQGVWRNDRKVETLLFTANPANDATGHVLLDSGGVPIPAVAFDDVIREVTDQGRQRVKWLKIDCEGSEFPILLTSRTLHLIDHISGEYHNYGFNEPGPHIIPESARVGKHQRYTIHELAHHLQKAGFDVTWNYHVSYPNPPIGLFWAHRLSSSARMRRRLRTGVHLVKQAVSKLRAAG